MKIEANMILLIQLAMVLPVESQLGIDVHVSLKIGPADYISGGILEFDKVN